MTPCAPESPKSFAIIMVRVDGPSPGAWYVTTDRQTRDVALFACHFDATGEGQRVLNRESHDRITHVRITRYDPTHKGEQMSCNGPDLSGLGGWMP